MVSERRRRILGALATAGTAGLAGCGGGDDGGEDDGGDGDDDGGGNTDGEGDDNDDDSGDNDGGSDTVEVTLLMSMGEEYPTEEFDEFSMSFDRVEATATDGETATIEIGETIDLVKIAGGPGQEVGSGTIPAGEHDTWELYASVSNVVAAGGGEPDIPAEFSSPAELVLDRSWEAGESIEADIDARLSATSEPDGNSVESYWDPSFVASTRVK